MDDGRPVAVATAIGLEVAETQVVDLGDGTGAPRAWHGRKPIEARGRKDARFDALADLQRVAGNVLIDRTDDRRRRVVRQCPRALLQPENQDDGDRQDSRYELQKKSRCVSPHEIVATHRAKHGPSGRANDEPDDSTWRTIHPRGDIWSARTSF